MITKIDILNFGLYQNYLWNDAVGNNETFRRLNIIYGRNYSGKTTLSRILKCIEDGGVHKNYSTGQFTITLSDSSVLTHKTLNSSFKIRVYNSDFVRENLSWLYNQDGTIEPFTILGAKNVELDKQIKELENILGSIENATGLIFEADTKAKEVALKKGIYDNKFNDLEDKLRKRANDKIKVDSNLFVPTSTKKSYSITDIKNDISSIEKDLLSYILSENEVEERKKVLKDILMSNILPFPDAAPNFSKHYEKAKELLTKKIKPSTPIMDLVSDSLLQGWVHQGIDKHKGKRSTCGFCGNIIDDGLWNKLDAHFSKESEELRSAIIKHIGNLEQAKQALSHFISLSRERFYPSLTTKFDSIMNNWTDVKETYEKSIDSVIEQLSRREKDIFKEVILEPVTDASESLVAVIKSFNLLIDEHNGKNTTLGPDQIKARTELRKSDIAQYLSDINYQECLKQISDANTSFITDNNALLLLNEEVQKVLNKKTILEAQAKDESKGAELVNQRLSHFFGHSELRLIADGASPNTKFKIQREGIDANNLSEGECSLISFCYFIAKLEDELKDELNSNKLIIYIDDPISSLDSNHIFFMFSLIESIIAKPKKYGQLFISTHNLDFLKYLRRLTIPMWKPQANSKDKADIKHFIVDRKNKESTLLRIAPDYLKNYITEFNYLFEQIYKCTTADAATLTHDHQYNFGNNMRKFLEAYLFYKYPSHKLSNDERLKKFFQDDNVSLNLVNRVINEYSHIGEQFERGMNPIDIDEIGKISGIVITKIKESDPNQYGALVESIQ